MNSGGSQERKTVQNYILSIVAASHFKRHFDALKDMKSFCLMPSNTTKQITWKVFQRNWKNFRIFFKCQLTLFLRLFSSMQFTLRTQNGTLWFEVEENTRLLCFLLGTMLHPLVNGILMLYVLSVRTHFNRWDKRFMHSFLKQRCLSKQ